jgi:hypothetical protein
MRRGEVAPHLPGAIRRSPRRLRDLTLSERLILAQTPLLLPLAALALRRSGLRRVQSRLTGHPFSRPRTIAARRPAEAARLAWIVKVSAMYGPWRANCLQRSLVLWWYLRRRGLDADLRIGVRRDRQSGLLDFHAWIEHAGKVINDRPEVRERYATFDQAIAPPQARFD